MAQDTQAKRRAERRAFVRGYVAAVAEFARSETTPKRVLASAGINRKVAVQCGVNPVDMTPLRGKWMKPK
jgi:hypothetical protein